MGRTIFLNPKLYAPRMNWRFCHELAHILLNHSSSNTVSYEQELEAEHLAGEIMVPTAEFRKLMHSLDIPELVEHYPHASWEVICRRWAQIRPAVLSIFDNEQLTYRRGPENFAFPLQPTEKELCIVKDCFSERTYREVIDENGVRYKCFFVDSGSGVRRVLLLSEVSDL